MGVYELSAVKANGAPLGIFVCHTCKSAHQSFSHYCKSVGGSTTVWKAGRIAMSAEGTILAVGAPRHDGSTGRVHHTCRTDSGATLHSSEQQFLHIAARNKQQKFAVGSWDSAQPSALFE